MTACLGGSPISRLCTPRPVVRFEKSAASPATLKRIAVDGLDFDRTVYLYGVAGHQRTVVASAMMKMLRAYDWSRYAA